MRVPILLGILLWLIFAVTGFAFAADTVDISAGLQDVDKGTLAQKIISIATGIGTLAGAIGVISLIYAGFKFATGGERERADAKQHVLYTIVGLGLTGLALLIVGFITTLIKG